MVKVDRGSAVLIEVEFKTAVAFGPDEYFDPTTPTVTIKDSINTAKVTTAALTKVSIGRYKYICQTASDWKIGLYSTTVNAISGTYSDITIEPRGFELK